ncbi:hypothetical protein GQ42DRAFT_165217 [Ramicandelaber brevisporus]|nr:hypothetical protein GQ42DRAFT_165537 [Ramicandelaber brevisporus]KAI8866837.1 hypothetical protein GQ42DRAFT_165217 [Ramicandelaber brevisporus]
MLPQQPLFTPQRHAILKTAWRFYGSTAPSSSATTKPAPATAAATAATATTTTATAPRDGRAIYAQGLVKSLRQYRESVKHNDIELFTSELRDTRRMSILVKFLTALQFIMCLNFAHLSYTAVQWDDMDAEEKRRAAIRAERKAQGVPEDEINGKNDEFAPLWPSYAPSPAIMKFAFSFGTVILGGMIVSTLMYMQSFVVLRMAVLKGGKNVMVQTPARWFGPPRVIEHPIEDLYLKKRIISPDGTTLAKQKFWVSLIRRTGWPGYALHPGGTFKDGRLFEALFYRRPTV